MNRGQKYSVHTWQEIFKKGKQVLRQKIQLSVCYSLLGHRNWAFEAGHYSSEGDKQMSFNLEIPYVLHVKRKKKELG